MIYYICETNVKGKTAGSKAPNDIEKICEKLGFISIEFPHRNANNSTLSEKIYNINASKKAWRKIIKKLKQNDVLICQYPMANVFMLPYVTKMLKSKRVTLIVFVHDLNAIRGIDTISRFRLQCYSKCEENLKIFDYVICHNEIMKKILIENGFLDSQILVLEMFDYLCKNNNKDKDCILDKSIVFAGNLSKKKSGFIYKLRNKDYIMNLYGMNYEDAIINRNIRYCGAYDPEILPFHLDGGFGLIWDGDECDTCAGSVGEYLKINNPHKLSLYIASNIPVIAWEEAAVASFIKKNDIGFVVQNLDELDNILRNVSQEKYNRLKNNVSLLGRKLRDGYFTEYVVKQCLKNIEENK